MGASPSALCSGDLSQAWKAGSGSTFFGVLSGEAALGDRLRLSSLVMSEARAPLYPLDSKPVLRYSRKKDAKLTSLILESVEASIVSPGGERLSSVRVSWSESRWACYLISSKMVEPSQMGDMDGASVEEEVQMGVLRYPEVVQDAKACYHTIGISFEGDENGFLDFLTLIDEGQCQEDPASVLKTKGSREVKNLECSINFDARRVRSSRGKGKRIFDVM